MKRTVFAGAMMLSTAILNSQSSPQQGIQVGDLDQKVQPCDNFFAYSNGTWRAQNPIPASMDRWSRRWKAGEENKNQLQGILEKVSHEPNRKAGSPAQQTGDFYAACMDTKSIDARGLQPIKPYMEKVDAAVTEKDIQQLIDTWQQIGIGVPFGFNASQDVHNPTRVIADVSAGGLGLPDRDYYIKPEKRFEEARAQYLLYVANIFELAGSSSDEARTEAAQVMQFETALAKASLDNVALRDPHATDHQTTFAALQKMTPDFDWSLFYQHAGVATTVTVNVEQPEFMEAVERQLMYASVQDWKVYLKWQFLNNYAGQLPEMFENAHFGFYQKQLAGVSELKPRATRCAEATDQLLGEALGQEYVKQYFPPEAKQRATVMVQNILSAMHETIQGLDWMSPETKTKALEKLSAVTVKVGYPDKWKNYSSVTVTPDHYFADTISAAKFAVADDHATIGKPVDRSRWGMTPPTSNAYYNPVMNEIVFPAGILQPPAFSLHYTDAVNYGAIGVVIGHEISHGFDDQGAQFDASGRLQNWWTDEDKTKFEAKTACVVHQFDGYTIDGSPEIHINGKLVLGESIGDLAGLKIAYRAFKKTAQGQSEEKTEGFTPDQQFFIAWGQFRGDETRPETQKMMVQGDPHPVAKYRVLGPLSNFPPFADAFQCKQGSAMVRPATDRCVVW